MTFLIFIFNQQKVILCSSFKTTFLIFMFNQQWVILCSKHILDECASHHEADVVDYDTWQFFYDFELMIDTLCSNTNFSYDLNTKSIIRIVRSCLSFHLLKQACWLDHYWLRYIFSYYWNYFAFIFHDSMVI